MDKLCILKFGESFFDSMLDKYSEKIYTINSSYEIERFLLNSKDKFKKIIFVFDLNIIGMNYLALEFLEYCKVNKIFFDNVVSGILVKSKNEYNTKSFSKKFIFEMNELGCSFVGHPVVEATNSLNNFKTWQKTMKKSKIEICEIMSNKLIDRVLETNFKKFSKKNILVLHASSNKTSNTLSYWKMIKENLVELIDDCNYEIEELHVENGTVTDCKGCEFTTCMHFAKKKSCFYGGPMVKEILPSIEKSDIIIWITPNYNDSVSAKLMAVINRLTVLYRRISFYEKAIYNVVVSGNSGSDTVAMQVLNSLNINKGFFLPAKFSFKETANDPKEIFNIKDIDIKAKKNAQIIFDYICGI